MTTTRSIVTALALASAATGTAVALALPGNAAAGVPTTGTFTVHAHPATQAYLDLGRSGHSAGDEDLFTAGLTRDGDHVGMLVGSCRIARVSASAEVQLCEFDLRLGAAQITTSGVVVAGRGGPGTFTLPISGGTGGYRGASGQIAITASNARSLPITVSLDA